MRHQFLIHDVSWLTAQDIIAVFAGLLRDDERVDAFHETYEHVKAGIEAYEVQRERMMHRLKPSKN